MPLEVLTMDRVGVDVYPLQTGVGLAEVTTFGKYLGGSPTNVAVAAARYGHPSAVVTKTGRDPFGDFVRTAPAGYGVDTRFVGTSDIAPTPVTFCEIFPPDDFPLYFYRLPKAPDLDLRPEELDLDAVREAGILWITGTGLSEEPSRSAILVALAHRAKSGTTVFDLDWRPMFWKDAGPARSYYAEALSHTTVAVGNLDECEVGMIGVNVPVPVPMSYYSFGGWKDSLSGDSPIHGPEGIPFYTRPKVVTTRWPQTAQQAAAGFDFPTSS